MAEQLYPPINGTQAPMPSKFFSMTPTTTATQFDTAGISCVGVNIQNPSFNDTPAAVNAYLYVQDSGGKNGVEIAPGETKFVACSNTNQLKLLILTGAGGTVAFARIEAIRLNGGS